MALDKTFGLFPQFNKYCPNPCQGLGKKGLWRRHNPYEQPRLSWSHRILGCSVHPLGGFLGSYLKCGAPLPLTRIMTADAHSGHQKALQSQLRSSKLEIVPRAPVPKEVSRSLVEDPHPTWESLPSKQFSPTMCQPLY